MKRANSLLRVKNGKTRRDLTTQPSRSYTGTTNKLTGVNMKNQDKQLNEITDLLRKKWGKYALEAAVAHMSTVVTSDQLDALIKHLKNDQIKLDA